MQVVNVRNYGGVKEAKAAGVIYVARPSPLGNPFSFSGQSSKVSRHEVETREEAIARYRVWLHRKLVTRDPKIISVFETLNENSILGCWCHPVACHADIIVKAWIWWNKHGRSELVTAKHCGV